MASWDLFKELDNQRKEIDLASYYRQFSIPESLDHEKTGAEFSNGNLTLKVTKTEAVKPRNIEVQMG